MDRRVGKTMAAFEDALFYFLERKEIQKITVKEICDYANMNRGTFYLHYEDIYDLLSKTEDDYMEKIIMSNGELPDEQGIREHMDRAFNCVLEHKERYRLLLCKQESNRFARKFAAVLKQIFTEKIAEVVPEIDVESAGFMSMFYVGGVLGLMYDWVNKGCCENINDILDLSGRLMDYVYQEARKATKL